MARKSIKLAFGVVSSHSSVKSFGFEDILWFFFVTKEPIIMPVLNCCRLSKNNVKNVTKWGCQRGQLFYGRLAVVESLLQKTGYF